ncbi:MAG: hypothetical protein AAGI70_00690 [Pseudomonadota bacterium]
MTSDDDDRRLDALVRAASDEPTDEGRLAARVLSRLDAPRRVWPRLPAPSLTATALGFASLLLVASLGGYQLPDVIAGEEEAILALAFGDPSAFGSALTSIGGGSQ